MGKLIIKQGDITQEDVDVIVNAANSGLRGGGGVDGAIHWAAGPSVMQECRSIGSCPTGEAVITNGGNLKAKKIIHTVGPVWQGGSNGEPKLLENAYKNSMELAKANGLKKIAFPSIATGVYGYPIEKAAEIAIGVAKKYLDDFTEVRFITFSNQDFEIYQNLLKE